MRNYFGKYLVHKGYSEISAIIRIYEVKVAIQ